MGRKTKYKNLKEQKAKVTKADGTKNGDKLQENMAEAAIRDSKKHPLWIDSKTTIYVKKEKCTPEYAKEYKLKMGML